VYKFWDSITKEDLEFSVGSKANVWEVKDPLLLKEYEGGRDACGGRGVAATMLPSVRRVFLGRVTCCDVMMVYKFWDSITKEDLEFSVGSKANVWEVKDPLRILDLPNVGLGPDRELEVLLGDRVPELVHHHDGEEFFNSLCMLLAVMMVYKFWDSITKEDLEFSVGSKAGR
jgi:hypothetical protein